MRYETHYTTKRERRQRLLDSCHDFTKLGFISSPRMRRARRIENKRRAIKRLAGAEKAAIREPQEPRDPPAPIPADEAETPRDKSINRVRGLFRRKK